MNPCGFSKSRPYLLKMTVLALAFLPASIAASVTSPCETSLDPDFFHETVSVPTPKVTPTPQPSPRTIFDEFREKNLPLERAAELLADHQIPEPLRKYYDFERGVFDYQIDRKVPLAIENGDAKLKAIRVNVEKVDPALGVATIRSFGHALEKMDGVELWVLSHHENGPWLDSLTWSFPKDVRKRIKFIPYRTYSYPWAQDGSKPLADGSGVLATMVDIEDFRINYLGATQAVAKAKGLRVEPSYFRFQGGNTLIGEKHIFIGSQIVEDVQSDLKISREDIIRALTVEFGKPVIEIDQTDFHIDLTLSIVRDRNTGEEVVLLDSQALAMNLLLDGRKTTELPEDRDSYFKALLAEPNHRTVLTKGERSLKKVLETETIESIMTRERRLDSTAERLKELGYRVVRVPGLFTEGNYFGSTRIFNYSNAVYSGPHALVAEMGVETWDKATQEIFRDLGYDPIPMPVAQLSLTKMGAIHCLTEGYRRPIKSKP